MVSFSSAHICRSFIEQCSPFTFKNAPWGVCVGGGWSCEDSPPLYRNIQTPAIITYIPLLVPVSLPCFLDTLSGQTGGIACVPPGYTLHEGKETNQHMARDVEYIHILRRVAE